MHIVVNTKDLPRLSLNTLNVATLLYSFSATILELKSSFILAEKLIFLLV